METYAGRYWRYENARLSLIPIDETNPRLGGKVKVTALIMDWITFTPYYKTLYGIYTDDFLTYGEFSKSAGDILADEGQLLKLTETDTNADIAERTTFRFENNRLYYKREING